MTSDYGLGVVDKLNPALDDLLDVKVPVDIDRKRNDARDFIFRYNFTTRSFELNPAATQQHDHPTDLSQLTDVDSSIENFKTTNDSTPFAFTWDPNTGNFMPYSVPRNLNELLESVVTVDQNLAGIPHVIYYDDTDNKYKMRDLRHYIHRPPENPLLKLIDMPLHLTITSLTAIFKNDGLRRWINSGKWYCSYQWERDSGQITLFKDGQLKILGLKSPDSGETAVLTVKGCRPTPIITDGTLVIRIIKLDSEDKYDPFIGGYSIKCKKRTKCAVIISLDSNNISGEGADLSFVGDGVDENLDFSRDNTDPSIDISTITLRHIIIQDIRYFPSMLSREDLTALLAV